jgi:hypothetical protein
MTKQVESTIQTREKLFIKAKLEGKNNTQAAMIATGTNSKDVAKKQGSRLSASVNVQDIIRKELKKLKVTPSKILKIYAEALEATKLIVHGKDPDTGWTEEVPDHKVRMQAADKFSDLLGIKGQPIWKPVPAIDKPSISNLPQSPQIAEAIENGDEIEMQRIIFKKDRS